jgi:hypothetical protein
LNGVGQGMILDVLVVVVLVEHVVDQEKRPHYPRPFRQRKFRREELYIPCQLDENLLTKNPRLQVQNVV